MDSLNGFLHTILDFLVQIVLLFISMFQYVLQFVADLIKNFAASA